MKIKDFLCAEELLKCFCENMNDFKAQTEGI